MAILPSWKIGQVRVPVGAMKGTKNGPLSIIEISDSPARKLSEPVHLGLREDRLPLPCCYYINTDIGPIACVIYIVYKRDSI